MLQAEFSNTASQFDTHSPVAGEGIPGSRCSQFGLVDGWATSVSQSDMPPFGVEASQSQADNGLATASTAPAVHKQSAAPNLSQESKVAPPATQLEDEASFTDTEPIADVDHAAFLAGAGGVGPRDNLVDLPAMPSSSFDPDAARQLSPLATQAHASSGIAGDELRGATTHLSPRLRTSQGGVTHSLDTGLTAGRRQGTQQRAMDQQGAKSTLLASSASVADMAQPAPPLPPTLRDEGTWYAEYLRAVVHRRQSKGDPHMHRYGGRGGPAQVRPVELQPPVEMEDAGQLMKMPPPALETAFQAYMEIHALPGELRDNWGWGGRGSGPNSWAGARTSGPASPGRHPAQGAAGLMQSWPHYGSEPQSPGQPLETPRQPSPTRSIGHARASTAPVGSPTRHRPHQHQVGSIGLYQAKKRRDGKQQEIERAQQQLARRIRETEGRWQQLRKSSHWETSLPVPRGSVSLGTSPPAALASSDATLAAAAAPSAIPNRLLSNGAPLQAMNSTFSVYSTASSVPSGPFFNRTPPAMPARPHRYAPQDSQPFAWPGALPMGGQGKGEAPGPAVVPLSTRPVLPTLRTHRT